MSSSSSSSSKSPVAGVPVIPGGSLLTGHLGLMREPDFQKSLQTFSVDHADANGRCCFYMGPTTPALSVTRARDVQTLLHRSAHRELFPLMGVHLDKFFGSRNIGVLTGREWKRQRRVVVQALHGKDFQQHNRQAIRTATGILMKELEQIESVPDVGVVFRRLAFDIFGQAALHTDFGCCRCFINDTQPQKDNSDNNNNNSRRLMDSLEFLASDMMRRMGRDIWNPASHLYDLPTAANRKHARERSFLRGCIADLVAERRQLIMANNEATTINKQEEVPQDLLTGLLEASSSQQDENEDDTTLADTLISLLFAGYETTSVALTYVLYMLSQHPEVEEKCLEEIRRVADQSSSRRVAQDVSADDDDDDDDYIYLKAVIRETLRLYPPAISTTRTLEKETKLPGVVSGTTSEKDDEDGNDSSSIVTVPKGTYLYFPIWTIQRDAHNFEDPLQFCPERWVGTRSNAEEEGACWRERKDNHHASHSAFCAFSAGARSCAGEHFAMEEMTLVLSLLLDKYHFDVAFSNYELTPHRDGFVQSPKGGLPMTIVQRSS